MDDTNVKGYIDKKIKGIQVAFDSHLKNIKPFYFDRACDFIKD